MRLSKAHISKYRSIRDTGEFEIENGKTILVGPNEAGKTAILQALQQLKGPTGIEGFEPLRDYPRSEYNKDIGRGTVDPATVTVVEGHFKLELGDLEGLPEGYKCCSLPWEMTLVKKWFRYAGLALVFLYFFVGGIAHFSSTETFVRIVPPYVPYPLAAVYVSGIFEILGAIGICLQRWRQWAGNGLLALTVCVTPANVYMWMNPDLFPTMSPTVLFWRLPLQLVLLLVIWWSTRAGQRD